jgi:hypothetical protein
MHLRRRKGKISLPFFNPKYLDRLPLNMALVIREFSTGTRVSVDFRVVVTGLTFWRSRNKKAPVSAGAFQDRRNCLDLNG